MGPVSRYRALVGLAGLALLLVPVLPGQPGYPYFFVRLDYAIWASVLLVSVAALQDLRELSPWPATSTLLLEVLGLTVAWAGRLYSVVYTFLYSSRRFYVGGFTWEPGVAAATYAASFLGSSVVVACLAIHGVLGRPVVLASSASLGDVCRRLRGALESLGRYPEAAGFAVGFLVRLLPEVIWWPRLVGFDTVSYVAHLRDFTASPAVLGSYYWMGYYRNVPPLLDWLLYPVALVVDPLYVFKLYPPIVYGVLAALVARYSRRVLNQGGWAAILAAVASSLSLATLRLSWDLHKQLLSQVLVVSALTLIDDPEGCPRRLLLATVPLALAGLASEFGAAVAIAVSAYTIALRIARLGGRARVALVATYVAVATHSYTLISWYLGTPVAASPVLGYVPPVVLESHEARPEVYPYLLACLGPLLPLYLAGAERLWGRAGVSVATVSTLVLISLAPLVAPWTDVSMGEWDRAVKSAVQIYVAIALTQLGTIKSRALKTSLLLFALLPGLFAVGTEGLNELNSTLVASLRRMPTGLVPAAASPELYDLALRVGEEVSKVGRPLVVDPWVERFVHLYLRNPRPGDVLVVPTVTPEYLACTLLRSGLSRATAVTYADLGGLREVDVSEVLCSGVRLPAGRARVILLIEEVASYGPIKVVEVYILGMPNLSTTP